MGEDLKEQLRQLWEEFREPGSAPSQEMIPTRTDKVRLLPRSRSVREVVALSSSVDEEVTKR